MNDSSDMVARGQYPVGLAVSIRRAPQLIQGAPVRFVVPKEGYHLNVQGVEFIANAPHPNAAKLFLHWFYTHEGQSLYAKNSLAISVRKDVPQDYLPPEQRYVEGIPLMFPASEDFTVKKNEQLAKLAEEIFGSGR